jgi:hypothetical protein
MESTLYSILCIWRSTNQPTKLLNCADFDELLEYKVEMIIADRRKKGRKGRYKSFLIFATSA